MCRKAAARLHRSAKIVNPFADIRRGVLQHARDQADLVRRIHGEKRGACAAEVMKAHGLSELGEDACTHDVVDAACDSADVLGMRPIARHAGCDRAGGGGSPSNSAGDKAGVGSGTRKLSARLAFGVLRIEKDVHPGSIELEVPADGKGSDASPAYQPKAEQGQDEAISILQLTLLASGRQGERLVH